MTGDPDRKKEAARSFDDLADAYRSSETHREGDDLDTLASWCEGATRALDVATGAGHTAGAVRKRGVPSVIATDASPSMVRTSRAEFDGVEGVVADAERLPFVADSFDALTCRIAAHHFPDPEAFVSEAARVLRHGGTFAFEDNVAPDDDELAAFLDRVERLRDPTHVESYRTSRWHDWMERAGFRIEETRRFRKTLAFDPWVDAQVTDPDVRRRVRGLLADAPEEGVRLFQIDVEDGRVRSFATPKVVIRATRAGQTRGGGPR